MRTIIKSLNLALAFFLELCLLVALGSWGFRTGSGWIARIALGIGVPAVTRERDPYRPPEIALAGAPPAVW